MRNAPDGAHGQSVTFEIREYRVGASDVTLTAHAPDGRLIGTAKLSLGNTADLWFFRIKSQGPDCGRQLFDAVLRRAREQGIKRLKCNRISLLKHSIATQSLLPSESGTVEVDLAELSGAQHVA